MKSMERAHVEMIEVRVGKKHDVELGEVANGQRGRGQAFGSECKTGQPDSDPRNRTGSLRIFIPKKLINTVACRAMPRLAGYRSTPPDLAEQKLERLDAIFRQSIHARGNRTNGERVSRRDFGFDFSSAKGI
jgi:hypothetical protein